MTRPSNSKSWKVLETVFSHLKENSTRDVAGRPQQQQQQQQQQQLTSFTPALH